MDWLRQLRFRLLSFFRKRVHESEMEEELRAHLQMEAQQRIAAGVPAAEAYQAAQRSFGGVEQVKEYCRDQRTFQWIEQFLQDVHYALRSFRKSPGFTLVAVLSLGIGIGANTAFFSLLDDVFLRSLSVERPGELVLFRWLSGPDGLVRGVEGTIKNEPGTGLRTSTSISPFVYERMRGQEEVLTSVFGFAELQQLNIGVDGHSEARSGQVVTGDYFRGLGVRAFRGRTLTPEDDQPGVPLSAVISYAFWQERFAGEDSAIGKTIRLNMTPATIVGVLPPKFETTLNLGVKPSVTLPLSFVTQADSSRDRSWWLNVMGRLRQGVTVDQAQAKLEPIFVHAARDAWHVGRPTEPIPDAPFRLQLDAGRQGLMDARRVQALSLRILGGLAGLILLIACANVASLLLARSATRRREFAVRLSVGAGRGRLVRQLLTESILLALMGGGLGIVVAHWGREALGQLQPIGAESLSLNFQVFAFTFGISLLTGLIFGLVPAWQATHVDPNQALKGGGLANNGGVRFGLRNTMMVGQIGMSVVLLVGAGLFLRTLHNLRAVNTGFDRQNLLLFRVDAGLSGYTGTRIRPLYERMLERLSAIPGVQAAALARHPLLSGSRRTSSLHFETSRPAGSANGAAVNLISPGFFATMDIPLLLGRDFTPGDHEGRPLVAIVNESFARRAFPGENPLGQRFSYESPYRRDRSFEIVGVVKDALYYGVRSGVPATVYTPFYQEAARQANFTLRTQIDPMSIADAVRQVVHEIDPNLPIFNLRTQEDQIDAIVSEERLFAALSAVLGSVALLLTCIGLYGLLAHQMAARTREIGLRIALGASANAVLMLAVRGGVQMAVLGIGVGLGAALALTRFASRILFGVNALDPLTLFGASALLLVVAALACWLPARRAANVDPMVALRYE